MAEELVSKWASESFFKQFDDAIPNLEKVVDLIAQANAAGRNSEGLMKQAGSLKEFSTAQKDVASAQDKLYAASQKLDDSWRETITLMSSLNGQSKEAVKVRQELVRLDILEQKAADARIKSTRSVTAELKNQATAAKAAQSAIDPTALKYLSDRLNDLRNGYQRLTQAERENAEIGGVVLKRIQELDAQLKAADATQGRFNRNVGNYNGAVEGFKLQITQIARELPSLASGLSTFAIAIGNNLPYAQEAFARLREENIKLREEGKPTTSVFKTLASSIFSWQTALIVALTVLPGLIRYLQQGSKAAQDAEKANKKYAKSLEEIGENSRKQAQEEIARMKVLTTTAANTSEAIATRRNAVLELQKTFPEYFANLSQEEILNGKVKTAVEATTAALLRQAETQANQKRFAAAYERVFDLTEAQTKAQEDLNKAQAKFNDLNGAANASPSNQYARDAAVRAAKEVADRQKELNAINTNLAKATAERDKYLAKAAASGSNPAGAPPPGSVAELRQRIADLKAVIELQKVGSKEQQENTKKLIELEKQLRAIEGHPGKGEHSPIAHDYYQQDIAAQKKVIEEKAKMRAADLKEDMADFKRIADDEKESLDVRLAAYKVYLTDKKALIQQEKDAQIEAARNTISELNKEQERNNSLIGGGKLNATQKESLQEKNKAITEQIKALNAEILRLAREAATEQRVLEQDSAKDIENIRKSSIQEQIKIITEGLTEISNATSEHYRAEKDALQKQYDEGTISYKDFRSAYDKVNAKENNETIEKQKAFTKNTISELLKAADVPPEVIAMVRAKLDALYDKPAKDNKRSLADKYGDIKSRLQSAKNDLEPYEDFANTIASINSSLTQRRIQEIDDEIAKINEKRDAEIAGIEASALSEEEKQKKIAAVKANADAQEKALDADKRARQRRAAQFEKSITIAEIIAETALATVRALGSKPYTPANIALAAATAAVGAAKLATAIAAPLPSYEHGTRGKAHPGGPAMLFEGNKPELVMEPGKKPWMGRMQGVYELAKGAEVISNRQLKDIARFYTLGLPALIPQQGYPAVDFGQLQEEMKGVKQAIKDKPVAQLNVTGMGMQRLTRQANNITEYIKSFSC